LSFPANSISLFGFHVFLASVFVGCSALPTLRFDPPFGRSDWVEFQDSRVVAGSISALAVTISNRRNVPLWIRMEIDEIDGDNDCMNILKLEPETKVPYSCPQASLGAGRRFRVQATVYKDSGNTKVVESINRLIEVRLAASGQLELLGRPAD